MYETRRVFSSSGDVSEEMFGIFEIQIIILLRLRLELVNDQNDRTEQKLYPEDFFQKVNK
jgi:hypothetical protein